MKEPLKNQSNANENGVYVYKISKRLKRSDDMNSNTKILASSYFIEEGDINKDKLFVLTTDNKDININDNTKSLTFAEFTSGSGGGEGTQGSTGTQGRNRITRINRGHKVVMDLKVVMGLMDLKGAQGLV